MPGTLYVVPTPIGRLDDLSPRARAVLGTVAVVAAEDTRVTRQLLGELGITPPRLVSNHDHNERERADDLLEALRAGLDVALVSDAGTPLVSDPGYRLVCAAVEAGLPVVPLPGPNAVTTALSASGLPTDRFVFLGFLPRQTQRRAEALAERRWESATLVYFEAPHRVVESLRAMHEAFGPRRVCVARSLTKVWEELIRGELLEVADRLAEEERVLGEMTVVVEGHGGRASDATTHLAHDLVARLVDAGVSAAVVRDVVAGALDLPRREIYQLALSRKEGT